MNITSIEINGNIFTGGSGSSGSESTTLTTCTQEVVNGTNIVYIDPNIDSNFYVEINQNSSLQVGRLSSGTCKTLNLAIKGNGHLLTLAGMVRSADGSSINLSKLTNFIDYLQLFTFNGGQYWVLADSVKKYYNADYSNEQAPNNSWTVQLTFDQGSAFNLGDTKIYDYNTGNPYIITRGISGINPGTYYDTEAECRKGVLTIDPTQAHLPSSTSTNLYMTSNRRTSYITNSLVNQDLDFLCEFLGLDGTTKKYYNLGRDDYTTTLGIGGSYTDCTILEKFIYTFGLNPALIPFTPTGANTIKLQVTVPNTYPIGRVTFITDATSVTVSLIYDDKIVKEQTFVGEGSRTIEFIA